MKLQNRTYGLMAMVFGVLLISPDSLLVRLGDGATHSTFTLVFWRNLFGATIQLSLATAYLGGTKATLQSVRAAGKYFWLSVPIQTCGTVCLTLSFTKTSAANALVLFYLQPIWASLGSVLYFKDPLPRRTVVAVFIGLVAAVVVFFGTTSSGDDDNGQTSVEGDIFGLVAGVAYAMYFMVCRACSLARPGADMLPAAAAGLGLSSLIALPLAGDAVLDIQDDVFWLWITLNAVVLSVALMFMTSAMKYILPPENALIGLLELAVGPIWVYVGLGEVPSPWTLAALVVLMVTLGCHEYLGLREMRQRKRSACIDDSESSARTVVGNPVIDDNVSAPDTFRRFSIV
eukprot:m.115394 g.115394  ORF g.115394 m.115394 type:complete len:345 (+) comp13090_c0_seq3:17-1051(+)